MSKRELLIEYANSHSKKQIVWFVQRLFGVDAKYPDEMEDENPNHDPKTGRFAPGSGGGSSGGSESSGGSSFVSSIITPKASGGGKPAKKSAKENMSALKKSNYDTAKMCKLKAQRFPAGSEERKAYESWAHTMSSALPGRPTPEDSQKMKEKNLKNISRQLKPYAQEKYKKDLENEPKITNDLCDIADSIGTGMFGLPYRMKSAGDKMIDGKPVCRIAEKIEENQLEAKRNGGNDTYEAATDRLSDLVRYTQACTPDNLVDNAEKTMAELEKRGYKPVKVKNTWESFNKKNPYRGVNCVFESPEGTRFELQFHTAESLVGKEVQHGWYEEYRTSGIDPRRKAELGNRMYENMASMTTPRDIGRIKNYPPNDKKKKGN